MNSIKTGNRNKRSCVLLLMAASIVTATGAAESIGRTGGKGCGIPMHDYRPGDGLVDVTYSFGQFYVLFEEGLILRTSNGREWRVEAIGDTEAGESFKWLRSIAGNDHAMVVAEKNGRLYRKDQDTPWVQVFHDEMVEPFQVESNGNEFVVFAFRERGGAGSVLIYSANQGRDWERSNVEPSIKEAQIGKLSVVKNKYWWSSIGLFESDDGRSWRSINIVGPVLRGYFVEKNGIFINYMASQGVHWSADGVSWYRVPEPPSAPRRIAFADIKVSHDMLIGVGDCKYIWISVDGREWELIHTSLKETDQLEAVASNGKTIVAVGKGYPRDEDELSAIALVSTDGRHWRDVSSTVRSAIRKFRAESAIR